MDIFGLIALAKSQNGGAGKIFHFKDIKSTVNLLPIQGEEGDVYKVEEDNSYYAWNGEGWVNIGQLLSMDDVAALFDQVEDAGDAQVARIVAKGQEVEGSISGDYSELSEDVDNLKNVVQDLQYKEIAISSFTATPRQVEKGSTVTEVVLSYTLNKMPATLKLDGVDLIPASSGTETKTGLSLTENHSWTLAATDTGSPSHAAASDSETATLSFLNKAYWGVDTIPGTLNSAFVLGLANSVLTGTKARTITVNATSGKYIWYAVPTSFGTCSFKIGGFDGGFEAPATISLTNASGHTENYYVYCSTNPSLGNTTVAIS